MDAMIPVNVRIVSKETLYDAPTVDGTTQKTVQFEILRPENGWLFKHVVTDGSRRFDELIDKLSAHGSVGITAQEYRGDEPSPEWKDKVVWAALSKVDGIAWEGGTHDGKITA
ncbi:MAG: hypothetical protein V4555_04285 [Acidobacteriota bacterium]